MTRRSISAWTSMRLCLLCFVLIPICSAILYVPAASAQSTDASSTDTVDTSAQEPTQADIRELARLLGDQRIVNWLKEQASQNETEQSEQSDRVSIRERLRQRLDSVRSRATEIASAGHSVSDVPDALSRAWMKDVQPGDALRSVVYTIIFIFIGAGLEWLFWRYMAATRRSIEFSNEHSLSRSMRRVAQRGGLILIGVFMFSLGCIGSFLFFQWTPFVGHFVLGLLIGVVSLRAIVAAARFLLAPQVNELRLLPISQSDAKRAFYWTMGIATIGLACLLTADTLREIGVMGSAEVAIESAAIFLFVLALLACVWYWHMIRTNRHQLYLGIDESADGQLTPSHLLRPQKRQQLAKPLAWTALILAVAVLGLLGTTKLMWTVLLLSLLLPFISLTRNIVNDVFDRAATGNTAADEMIDGIEQAPQAQPTVVDGDALAVQPDPAATVVEDTVTTNEIDIDIDNNENGDDGAEYYFDTYRPIAIRLARFLLVIIAVMLLAAVWGKPIWTVSEGTGLAGRLMRAIVDITIAYLIADLIWVWARTWIDRRLDSYDPPEHGAAPGPEARMATLLPLFRKVLMITVITMMALIILSSLGVNIGPLLAGAGVVGIAIGFGAQTLVRDIVSGVFFLIDDAFRVGEYIEMGDLRGTVESMSLRSLRVRHHRGAVHTIPFGELTALTNHSRDWAIIKMEFRVPFDTDLKLVKKLVKQVGAELKQNEDYGHHLIEPLKSQGVRRMEEFNMVVGVKFMSKPGEQWTIRRDAYQRIRDAFDKNGINFAERNVKVEVVGDVPNEDTHAAVVGAAQNAIETQIDPALVPVDDTP